MELEFCEDCIVLLARIALRNYRSDIRVRGSKIQVEAFETTEYPTEFLARFTLWAPVRIRTINGNGKTTCPNCGSAVEED